MAKRPSSARPANKGQFPKGNKAAAGTGHNQRAARGDPEKPTRPRGRPPTQIVQNMRDYFLSACEFDEQGRTWHTLVLRCYYDALVARGDKGEPLPSSIGVAGNIHEFLFPKEQHDAQRVYQYAPRPPQHGDD